MKLDRQKLVADLVSLAEREPPVRWLHQGRDPDVGLDCIGLIRWAILQQAPLPDVIEHEFAQPYHLKFDGVRMLQLLQRWLPQVERAEIAPADILLFYYKRNPQHVAVMVSETEVVEAYILRHAGISRILKQPLDAQRRLVGAFRIPDDWSGIVASA